MELYGGCATDTGNIRKVNQDAIFFRCLKKEGQCFALGMVCDGIGGLPHGELASAAVAGAAQEWFENTAAWLDIAAIETDILFSHFKDAAEDWNRRVRELILKEKCQMGTTMSALMMIRNRYYIIQAGDSRICLYRDRLRQLTVDASIQKLKNGEMKSYLSNYIGKEDELWFTTSEGSIKEGDLFLYGSDGLFHFLQEEDIEELQEGGSVKYDLHECGRRLIAAVMARGEWDNISAGLIAVGKGRKRGRLFVRQRRTVKK